MHTNAQSARIGTGVWVVQLFAAWCLAEALMHGCTSPRNPRLASSGSSTTHLLPPAARRARNPLMKSDIIRLLREYAPKSGK